MKNAEEKEQAIKKALEIINTGVISQKQKRSIIIDIEETVGYCYKHFDRIFEASVGCSLSNKIKDEMYMYAYQCFKTENVKLAQRKEYKGIPYFLFYFERRYGRSVYELSEDEFRLLIKERNVKKTKVRK